MELLWYDSLTSSLSAHCFNRVDFWCEVYKINVCELLDWKSTIFHRRGPCSPLLHKNLGNEVAKEKIITVLNFRNLKCEFYMLFVIFFCWLDSPAVQQGQWSAVRSQCVVFFCGTFTFICHQSLRLLLYRKHQKAAKPKICLEGGLLP